MGRAPLTAPAEMSCHNLYEQPISLRDAWQCNIAFLSVQAIPVILSYEIWLSWCRVFQLTVASTRRRMGRDYHRGSGDGA